VGPDTLFCRTSQWGLCYTPTSAAVKQPARDLEPRYEPQKGQYYYHDDDHHCDGDQVVSAHESTSPETHPEPEKAAPLD
jgi:hypothetical protein